MTEQLPNCPECGSAYAYEDRGLFICPECGHEWSPTEEVAEEGLVVKDSNGNLLADGDSESLGHNHRPRLLLMFIGLVFYHCTKAVPSVVKCED